MILGFGTINPFTKKPTGFIGKIKSKQKIHSIRKGNRWRKGMTIHFAAGVRTKKYKCFLEGWVISTQKIEMIWDNASDKISTKIDGKQVTCMDVAKLALNDGFTNMQDFENWFNPLLPFSGQIIHWTFFKY